MDICHNQVIRCVWPGLLELHVQKWFFLTGQKLTAQTALSYGLIDEIVKEKSVLSRAMDLCFTVSAADPVKSKRIKAMCNTGLYMH